MNWKDLAVKLLVKRYYLDNGCCEYISMAERRECAELMRLAAIELSKPHDIGLLLAENETKNLDGKE